MIFVAMHRGESLISRGIRLFEPPYSHTELWFADQGVVISADAEGVVQKPIPKLTGVGKGDVVDFFTFREFQPNREQTEAYYEDAYSYVGTPYDFRSLFFGFTFKWPENEQSLHRVICSGLVLRWSRDIGRPFLLRVQPDRVSPAMISYSPQLEFSHSRILCKD